MHKKYLIISLIFILIISIGLTGCNSGGGNGGTNAEIKQQANNVVDDFLNALERENVIAAGDCLASDFTYEHNGETMNKSNTLDMFETAIDQGGEYHTLQLNNIVNEIMSDNVVKISGSVYTDVTSMQGDRTTDTYPTQFKAEKKNGEWKIILWIDEG